MYTVEPKKTRTRFSISIAKSDPKRLARFRKELEALLKKHKVKKTR